MTPSSNEQHLLSACTWPEQGRHPISNRVNDGAAARYAVRTPTGQEFNCFLGDTASILGRQLTDVICIKRGEASKKPLLR